MSAETPRIDPLKGLRGPAERELDLEAEIYELIRSRDADRAAHAETRAILQKSMGVIKRFLPSSSIMIHPDEVLAFITAASAHLKQFG